MSAAPRPTLAERAAALVERTCRAQGLPPTIEDESILDQVARLLEVDDRRDRREAS